MVGSFPTTYELELSFSGAGKATPLLAYVAALPGADPSGLIA